MLRVENGPDVARINAQAARQPESHSFAARNPEPAAKKVLLVKPVPSPHAPAAHGLGSPATLHAAIGPSPGLQSATGPFISSLAAHLSGWLIGPASPTRR